MEQEKSEIRTGNGSATKDYSTMQAGQKPGVIAYKRNKDGFVLLSYVEPGLYDDYSIQGLRALQAENNQAGVADLALAEAIRTYNARTTKDAPC